MPLFSYSFVLFPVDDFKRELKYGNNDTVRENMAFVIYKGW